MFDNQDIVTNLNELQLTVPLDGTPGLVEGQKWRAPWGMDASQEVLRSKLLYYEGIRSCDGKLVDVVAWEPACPEIWYRQTGYLPLLGAEELERVSWTTLPCYLVATPARWRNLDRRGICSICVLDWAESARFFGTCWGSIIVETQAFLDTAAKTLNQDSPRHLTVAPIP